jgi:hypothetical protein
MQTQPFGPIFVLLLASAPSMAAAPTNGLSNFSPFALADGINHVAHFTKDGREATIFKAWRDNGNAHGYYVYMITLPARGSRSNSAFNVVGSPGFGSRPLSEFVTDDPHTGEDWVSSIVFGRGRINGITQTLMIRATRIWQNSIPEPAITRFEISKLTPNDNGPGMTPEYFAPVTGFSSTDAYCNAYMAMYRELKIPLPKTYSGNRSRNGC